MPDRDHILNAIETYCRAETEKDRAAWIALFSPDIVHEDPVGVATRRGLEELGELWNMAMQGDVHLWAEKIIVRGSEAVAIMHSETGPAGNRRKTSPIVDLFRFDEAGKITSVRAFYDF